MNKYILVQAEDGDVFCSEINRHIGLGFILQGGVAIAYNNNTLTYAQAMIRMTVITKGE